MKKKKKERGSVGYRERVKNVQTHCQIMRERDRERQRERGGGARRERDRGRGEGENRRGRTRNTIRKLSHTATYE